GRRFSLHIFVFLIFLGSNIGATLTPLGDPPLFLGFLRGVDFFWAAQHLWPQTAFAVGTLLLVFFAIDVWLTRHEHPDRVLRRKDIPLSIRGLVNVLLIGVAVAAIVASAVWRPGISIDVFHTRLELQNLIRDTAMLGVGAASIWSTPYGNRVANGFTWEPMIEVA